MNDVGCFIHFAGSLALDMHAAACCRHARHILYFARESALSGFAHGEAQLPNFIERHHFLFISLLPRHAS